MSFFNNRRASDTQPLYPRPVPTPTPIITPPASGPTYPHTGRLDTTAAPVGSLESIIQQARYWRDQAVEQGNRAMELAAIVNRAETVRLVARRFLWGYAHGMSLKQIEKALERMRPDTGLPLHTTAGDLLELIRALDLEHE